MTRLLRVAATWDVPERWRGTPVADLLAYQNLGRPGSRCERAEILVAACMDHRISFRLPEGFAYVVRVGGANLWPVIFTLSYAVAIKGVRFAALVAHTGCGTAGLLEKREAFVRGLVENGGWEARAAGEHFDRLAPVWDVADPVEFVARQATRIQEEFPRVRCAALHYDLFDGMLSVVEEGTAGQ